MSENYEYEIQGKKLKLGKITIGASLLFDKLKDKTLTETEFIQFAQAVFYDQSDIVKEIDWMKVDVDMWSEILEDFFVLNSGTLKKQAKLLTNIS